MPDVSNKFLDAYINMPTRKTIQKGPQTPHGVQRIQSRITAYNSVLEQEVAKYPGRLVLVPISEIVHKIAETGKIDSWGRPASDEVITYNGLPLEGTLGYNSIFSLDGLHFNSRGNALIVNEIITSINQEFGSNLPQVNVNSYLGNTITTK